MQKLNSKYQDLNLKHVNRVKQQLEKEKKDPSNYTITWNGIPTNSRNILKNMTVTKRKKNFRQRNATCI